MTERFTDEVFTI